jgi:hypothetical protein
VGPQATTDFQDLNRQQRRIQWRMDRINRNPLAVSGYQIIKGGDNRFGVYAIHQRAKIKKATLKTKASAHRFLAKLLKTK